MGSDVLAALGQQVMVAAHGEHNVAPNFRRWVRYAREARMSHALATWLQSWNELNLAAGAALALVFIISGLLPIPRTFLCLAAGTIFGLPAIPIILPSTTLGGVIGFRTGALPVCRLALARS